jgi:hypothetical protein
MRQDVDEIKKVMEDHQYSLDTIICGVLKKFKFKSTCWQAGARKGDGYSVTEVLTLMLMLPFMLVKSVHSFYGSGYADITSMKKDVIYRLQNSEKMPWRRLLYGVAKRFQELVNPTKDVAPNSAFILDDTADMRTGYKIENISRVHDHTDGKVRFGFKHLVLGLFDGTSFLPLDFSTHSEKRLSLPQRKKQFQKSVTKGSNGDKRRQECRVSKITNALLMLKRAVKNGFSAKYVLVDSWFASKNLIATVRGMKSGAMHVVCGVRNDRRKYDYKGQKLNSKELRQVPQVYQ